VSQATLDTSHMPDHSHSKLHDSSQ